MRSWLAFAGLWCPPPPTDPSSFRPPILPQVATMNGNLYCIGTASPYQPMKAWPQQHAGGGTFTAK